MYKRQVNVNYLVSGLVVGRDRSHVLCEQDVKTWKGKDYRVDRFTSSRQ